MWYSEVFLINAFHTISFYTPWNQRFSHVFRGYRKRPVTGNALNPLNWRRISGIFDMLNSYSFFIKWSLFYEVEIFKSEFCNYLQYYSKWHADESVPVFKDIVIQYDYPVINKANKIVHHICEHLSPNSYPSL